MFNNNLPRGFIFLADLVIVFFSLIAAYLIRFNFQIPEIEVDTYHYVFPTVLGVRAITFYFFKTYSGIIRYTSTRDVMRILVTTFAGSLFFVFVNPITYLTDKFYVVPFSIIIIEFLLTVFGMAAFRMAAKILYTEKMNPSRKKTSVIIFGAGESGVITKRTLDRDAASKYKVIAFVDDNEKKKGKKVEGVTIYNAGTDLEKLLRENYVQHLIIAIQQLSPHRKQEIVELCLNYKTKVLNVPPVSNWINGLLNLNQLKNIKF